jgi:hypothetical protein
MLVKKLILTLTTLLVSSTALAITPPKPVEIRETSNIFVTPSVGYRYDVFKWSVPDNIFPEYKLSELVWKNRIVQPSVKIELEPQPSQFTILGLFKYGYILKHPSKSWDYDWDIYKDKTTGNIISKLGSKTKSLSTGNILDLSTAIGYSVGLFKDNLLTFYIGYDYSDYRYKNYGDKQLAWKTNYSFSSGGLASKYYFKTYSPWLGLSLYTSLSDKFSITPTIKYYSFKHKGNAYWIHRPDFKQNPSFRNKAKGRGLGIELDFIYKYSNNIDLSLNLATKKLKMKKGSSITFYNSHPYYGNNHEPQDLLTLSLRSSSISVGLKYKL